MATRVSKSNRMQAYKDAAMNVGATTAGIMGAKFVTNSLLMDKDGNYLLNKKDKTKGAQITGAVGTVAAIAALGEITNPLARRAVEGAAAQWLENTIVAVVPKIKPALGLQGIAAAEYDYTAEGDDVDWEELARQANAELEIQGVGSYDFDDAESADFEEVEAEEENSFI